jgi:hypothetical protein
MPYTVFSTAPSRNAILAVGSFQIRQYVIVDAPLLSFAMLHMYGTIGKMCDAQQHNFIIGRSRCREIQSTILLMKLLMLGGARFTKYATPTFSSGTVTSHLSLVSRYLR